MAVHRGIILVMARFFGNSGILGQGAVYASISWGNPQAGQVTCESRDTLTRFFLAVDPGIILRWPCYL